MNQQQPPRKKQIGDWVVITGGPNRNTAGEISAINHPRVTVRTSDGREVQTSSAWLDFAKRPAKRNNTKIAEAQPPIEQPVVPTVSVPPEIAYTREVTDSQPEPVQTDTPAVSESAPVVSEATSDTTSESLPETQPDANVAQNPYAEMTVVQLQLLVKERGISIARTKKDFIRILGSLQPETDFTALKGPELYSKVAEHHISRLRSKQDLVDLLSQGEAQ